MKIRRFLFNIPFKGHLFSQHSETFYIPYCSVKKGTGYFGFQVRLVKFNHGVFNREGITIARF